MDSEMDLKFDNCSLDGNSMDFDDISSTESNGSQQDHPSVEHIMFCNNTECDSTDCQQIKLLAFHYSICENDFCSDCNYFDSLISLHDDLCDKQCTFLYCKYNEDFHLNSLILPDDQCRTDSDEFSSSSSRNYSPLPPLPNQIHIQTPINTKFPDMLVPIKWIECIKCHQLRKVPDTLDVARLPHFECSLNIWDPPFSKCSVLSEDTKTSKLIDLQGNYLEYETEKEEFMESLGQYLKQDTGNLHLRTPTLGRKEVDLYRLFREVTAYGGSQAVVEKEGTWAKIYRGMENFSPTETSASFRLKKMYTKYLSGYETYIFHFVNPKTSSHKGGNHGHHSSSNNNSSTTNTHNNNNNMNQQPKRAIQPQPYIPKEWKCLECDLINGPHVFYCDRCHTVIPLQEIDQETKRNSDDEENSNESDNNIVEPCIDGYTNGQEIFPQSEEVNFDVYYDIALLADANILYSTPHFHSVQHIRHLSEDLELFGDSNKFDPLAAWRSDKFYNDINMFSLDDRLIGHQDQYVEDVQLN